jgi:hypothetical protein
MFRRHGTVFIHVGAAKVRLWRYLQLQVGPGCDDVDKRDIMTTRDNAPSFELSEVPSATSFSTGFQRDDGLAHPIHNVRLARGLRGQYVRLDVFRLPTSLNCRSFRSFLSGNSLRPRSRDHLQL